MLDNDMCSEPFSCLFWNMKSEPGLMLSLVSCLYFTKNEPHHAYSCHAYKRTCNKKII